MMKAIRKSDGKVIEVSSLEYTNIETNVKSRYCAADGEMYPLSDLDFSVDEAKEAEGEVLSGWVARNNDNSLYLFKAEPWYNSPRGYWDEPIFSIGCFSMPSELFPQITFDNSPMEVEITIKPKKKSSTK